MFLSGCTPALINVDAPPAGMMVDRCANGDDAAARYLQLTPEQCRGIVALRR